MATSPAQPYPSSSSTLARGPLPFGIAVGAAALIVAFVLVGFEVANWDRVAPGVTALGAPIGGMTRSEAAARIAPGAEALLSRPLQVRQGDRAWDTTPRDLGLRLESAELANEAYRVGREGNPLSRLAAQLGALTGGTRLSLGSRTDEAALDASLARIASQVDAQPRNARLVLGKDGSVQFESAQAGTTVDVPASRDRVAAALAQGSRTVDLVTRETVPAVTDDLVQPARDQLDRMLGAQGDPITLAFGGKQWPMKRADILKLLSVQGGTRAGQPAIIQIDDRPLAALAAQMAKEIDQEVQDARFAFNGGNLKAIRESRDGRSLDTAATVALIKEKLLAGERRADLPVQVVKPAVSSENPAALGITERIQRASTSFAGSMPEKKYNIKLAAERLNGVVVPPGGTFSFNKEVGPTTLEAGFQWGFGITGGENGVKTVPSVAGGICQVATTLFQPVFWAGYQLEERYWHLYWIPAYTSNGVVGVDAAVDEEAGLDLKWINPTDNYVLVQSATDESNVYFSLYGTPPKWKVTVDEAQITNRVPPDPKPVAQAEPTLPWGRTIQVESARDGFEVLLNRRVVPNGGGEPRVLNLKSTYQPSRNVTLVGTGNKPAGADVEAIISRIEGVSTATAADATKTPEPIATPAGGAPTPEAGGAPAQKTATAVATQPAKPTAQPTKPPAPPTPVPTKKPRG